MDREPRLRRAGFPGHDACFDPGRYELQTIRGNVELPAPELLRKVNELVVAAGHEAAGKRLGAALAGRCGPFVVETDVRHPTDISLLRDAALSLVRLASGACIACGVPGWRQRHLRADRVEEQCARADTARRWGRRPAEVQAFIDLSLELAAKADGSLKALRRGGCPERDLDRIVELIGYARLFADQIDRRVLRGETIPHHGKVFPIHGKHTRWIAKGKAGKPAELGVPVAVLEDGGGFVLGRRIMWTGGDTHAAVPLVGGCQTSFPDLRECSFDRGFHSPSNRRELDAMLEADALPKKGRLSAAERAREAEASFRAARRKHPGIESAVNSLEHRGLGRVRLRGADGFELAVNLSVLAHNIHRLGMALRDRERERMRRERRRRKRAA